MVFLSIYCLLAYVPDTYYSLIRAPYMNWLPWLIRFQPWLYILVAVPLCVVLFLENKQPERRVLVEFTLVLSAGAVFFFADKPLARVEDDCRSFLWSIVLLFPVMLQGILDIAADWKRMADSNKRPRRLEFAVPLALAAAVGIVDPGMSFVRELQNNPGLRLGAPDIWAWLLAVGADLLSCAFLVGLYNLPESLHSPRRPILRFFLYRVLTWFVLSRLIQNVLLNSLPFHSKASQVYAGALALTVLLFGNSLWLLLLQHVRVRHWYLVRRKKPRLIAVLGLLLLALAYLVPALIGLFDWNNLLEKIWTVGLWFGVFVTALLWRRMRSSRPYPTPLIVGILVLSPVLYVFALAPPNHESHGSSTTWAMDVAFEQHLSLDTTYRVVEEWWALGKDSLLWRKEKPCDELCQYLLTQTNLPRTTRATAVDTKMVQDLTPTAVKKPNVFIIVVDSLRRDYVSAYNPAVTFTPEIEKFASDSTVFRNSFTRYAGTALSEPAIWAGTMLLHEKYLQPFHNGNNLEKLLEVDGYQSFVSIDAPVLQVVLHPAPDLVRLDEDVKSWAKEDFCSTEREVESKISSRADPNRPIFMFAQPQNIHTVTLSSLPQDRYPKKPYPGFMPKTASELERLDGCFGRFVRYLKSSGLYDNSIIVLTADHGESYGEGGHAGHIMEVNPQVLQIPLIVHVPARMKNAYYRDPNQIAFNVDITPTIYYLLGHRRVVNDPRFGRPLFTKTSAEADAYRRESYLVAAAYGPVYGMLSNNGKGLFVANAALGKNEYFDLEKDPEGLANRVTPEIMAQNQKCIRNDVRKIGELYRFYWHEPTLMEWLTH